MLRRIIIGVIQIEVGLIFVLMGSFMFLPFDCTHGGFLSCFDIAWLQSLAAPTFLGYVIIAIVVATKVGKWVERRGEGN